MANFLIKKLQEVVAKSRHLGVRRSDDWVGMTAVGLNPDSLIDVGCGDGSMIFRYIKKMPRELHGVEGAPALKEKAEARGFKVTSFDLNGRWPYESNKFDVVHSSQVIEHLHNCRLFVEESFRVLKPGGTVVMATENLCSLLNCFALFMGYTPFSLMQTCGRYIGNPLGLHYNEPISEPLPIDHPAFAGISGHVRVLTVRQARELYAHSGFVDIEARSVSILPLPDGLSKVMESVITNRGHYLILKARKPAKA
jgi:SAM-dependent methyltransferase